MKISDLRELQNQGPSDPISTLRSIDLNSTELCNRTCGFCPRSDPSVYPNLNLKIELDLIEKIANDLEDIEFNGRVGFVGFGEPLLYKDLNKAISIIKQRVTDLTWLEVQTNGDHLTREKALELVSAGCNTLVVSMYDCDESDRFNEMLKDIPAEVILRHHYNKEVSYNLRIVNRNDLVKTNSEILNSESPCYLPFYKLVIDWNGNVLLCSNDWSKKNVIGNINNQSIRDIWLGETFNSYRKHLIKGSRRSLTPCNRCNVNGTNYGSESVAVFNKILS